MSTGWEDRAAGFVACARAPGHDAYWDFRDFFFDLLPPPGRVALEIGCGEGAGLVIEALREPRGFDDRDRRMPQFLLWRAVKR